MRLPISFLPEKLKEAGLIDNDGKVISFAKFKKLVDEHQYGDGIRKKFILYVGVKNNRFGFYPPTTNKLERYKIAYEYLVDTVNSELKQEFMDGNIQWGNVGIPLTYSDLRVDI